MSLLEKLLTSVRLPHAGKTVSISIAIADRTIFFGKLQCIYFRIFCSSHFRPYATTYVLLHFRWQFFFESTLLLTAKDSAPKR